MEEENQKEICQNVSNGCLCAMGLWKLFLGFYVFTDLHAFLLKSKRKLYLKKISC